MYAIRSYYGSAIHFLPEGAGHSIVSIYVHDPCTVVGDYLHGITLGAFGELLHKLLFPAFAEP